MEARRKRLIERSQAAREGRRFYAFYRGLHDAKSGVSQNPYPPGSELWRCWQAGQEFARDESDPPLCRFGPGGEFTADWPEGQP